MNESIELSSIIVLAVNGAVLIAISYFCGKINAYKHALKFIEEEKNGKRR